jgi:hypothetical protein
VLKVRFTLLDVESVKLIVDENTFSQNVLNCEGETILTIGQTDIVDRTEIIIRVAEILGFLEQMCNGLTSDGAVGWLMFQFEQPFMIRASNDAIELINREHPDAIAEVVTKEHAALLLNEVVNYIRSNIEPISPFLSQKLLSREVL